MLKEQPEARIDDLVESFDLDELDTLMLEPEELEPRITPAGYTIAEP